MAQNPFSKTNNFVKKPKRNTFDLSFQNNATFNFGTLYPVMCKEVIPGDSFRIEPTFALKFMPMVFPVQTRMNANLHFFYVRNRNLYKDWPDFIAKNKTGLTMPYLSVNEDDNEKFIKQFSTGSLGDYLGIPSTYISDDYGQSVQISGISEFNLLNQLSINYYELPSIPFYTREEVMRFLSSHSLAPAAFSDELTVDDQFITSADSPSSSLTFGFFRLAKLSGDEFNSYVKGASKIRLSIDLNFSRVGSGYGTGISPMAQKCWLNSILYCSIGSNDRFSPMREIFPLSTLPSTSGFVSNGNYDSQTVTWDINTSELPVSEFTDAQISAGLSFCFFIVIPNPGATGQGADGPIFSQYTDIEGGSGSAGPKNVTNGLPCFYYTSTFIQSYLYYVLSSSEGIPASGSSLNSSSYKPSFLDGSLSPFTRKKDSGGGYGSPDIPVSALPFRAYESIYNAFYRDIRNNPYDPNGDGNYEYNKYIPTMEGGADTNTYELHRRNWEQDFLTTAVQSPQQGTAPLVGVSGDGTFRFQDESGQTFTAKAIVSDDGNEITGFSLEDSKMPVGNVQFLMDVASAGFTINDFRSVNSFQRWLETNMRKGLRYRDQIMAHYGVSVRYDELDMPEFIGGMSVPVTVNQVTQTTPTDGSPLGMYAGQASAIGKGRSVTKYFDEHGFIMAIFSVTPVPNYSQLLPKYFLKTDALDYFFPEFGHIGYQPIFYNEVCPLQGYNAGGASELQKVFGYQRAWYEYLASTDEVHGEFRTTLRNYLINRVFSQAPELSEEFLLVDPEQVNDVFAVTTEDTGDKILGQIYFKISAKRPIPLFGIPKIDG